MSAGQQPHDFPVQSTKDVYVGRVMALRSDEVVMPGGRAAVREILEHPGAVAIAALDDDDRLMMIYQYRHALRRRIDEAAKYVALERLCLSPQCGFASTHHGNTLTEDEQWRKLELVVGVARDVWGG